MILFKGKLLAKINAKALHRICQPSKKKRTEGENMKKTILVVDDDLDSRNALCAILEALGYSVISYGSGAETLANLSGKSIDLAMLDVMMPEMNGYELLEQIRKLDEFANLQVFMVTARDTDDDMLKGYSHGADYYIPKPYTAKQIKFGLDQFFARSEQ